MKVLIVVSDMNLGGVTTSVINFCNELHKRGNTVHFLNMGKESPETESKIHHHIKKLRLSGIASNWQLGMKDVKPASLGQKIKLILLAFLKKLTNHSERWLNIVFRNYYIEEEYDVAIAFRQCAPCYYFVLNCTRAKKKIGFVHGELKYMNDISSWKKYMTLFDKIAYVSNAVEEEFIENYPELRSNSCAIYNMFNKEQILRLAQEDNPFLFQPHTINIVTVARIDNDFKRIDLIPEICKQLLVRTSTQFHWYIVGDGPDRETVEKKISDLQVRDVVTVCGFTMNPFAILKDADFSVLLSKSEAYPMTVIESFILGKPLVSTNFASIKEMMVDGKQGLIADFSLEDIVIKILKMIDEPGLLSSCNDFLSKYMYSNDIAYSQFLNAIGD